MTTPAPVPLRPAATVVVLRPAVGAPFEVLLVRRNDHVAFMAGAYVFPGGRLDDTDLPEPAGACDGLDTLGRCPDLTPAEEARYRVAAIRELLEEAGLLLARDATGAVVDGTTAASVRAAVPPESSLVQHLAGQGLRVALDAVMPFAHWVTPEIEIRRFDTRFLLAHVPAGQDASHDAGETTALEWLTPHDALARCERGEIMLPPPTWTVLSQLRRFTSVDDAWQWAATTPMVRVQPRFVKGDDATLIMLPGDPEYPRPDGYEPIEDTRFTLVEGQGWRPVRLADALPLPDDVPRPPLPPPPPSAPPPPLPPPVDRTPRPFQFTGSGAEYFRIWIVNLLLSVLTLGIYSAWAKVRRLRYFYGHTSLDGRTFGYHASPIAILKGRLIAYAVVAVFGLLGQVAPFVASVLYLPLAVLMPIVFVRAFRFRAANSSYGGVRFAFDGMEAEAYQVFLFLPMLLPFTLGIVYPYMTKRQREFFVSNSRCGHAQFGLELPTGRVYRIYVLAGVALLAWFALAAVTFISAAGVDGIRDPDARPGVGVLFGVLLLYAGIGATVVAVRTAFENLVWNHTQLDRHRFASRLRTRDMCWIYATNAVALAFTLGLAVPWARIRLARYRAESLTLLPDGPLETTALAGDTASATGAELSDAMDLDFGL